MKRSFCAGMVMALFSGAPVMAQDHSKEAIQSCAKVGQIAGIVVDLRLIGIPKSAVLEMAHDRVTDAAAESPEAVAEAQIDLGLIYKLADVVYDMPSLTMDLARDIQREMVSHAMENECLLEISKQP